MKVHLLKSDGAQTGPHDLHEVRAMFEGGHLTRDTQFWREGMPEWRPVNELLDTGLALADPLTPQTIDGDILDYLVRSPLVDGASQTGQSKIVMAVEALRRDDSARAYELFHASLTENHQVAAGWIGLAYVQAKSFGVGKAQVGDLRLAIEKGHPFCSNATLLDECYGQVLVEAVMTSVMLTNDYFAKFSRYLMSAHASTSSAMKAASDRNVAVLTGTGAAVFAHRTKSGVSQFVGATVAITAAVQAFEKHLEVKAHEADAKEATHARYQAETMLFASARAAYEAFQEAAGTSGRFSERTRKSIKRLRKSLGEMIQLIGRLQVGILDARLPFVLARCTDTSYVKANATGSTETSSFVSRMTNFGLGNLPLTKDVSSLFGDLVEICEDPALKYADHRENTRRTTQKIVSILLIVFGCCSLLASCCADLSDQSKGLATMDGITAEGWMTMGGILAFTLGILGISRRPTSLLPSRLALRERVSQTMRALKATHIRTEDLNLKSVAFTPADP